MNPFTCASLLLLAVGDEQRPADLIELKSGKTIEGYVLLEADDKVVIRVGSRDKEIATDDVASIRSANRSLAVALDRLDALSLDDAVGLLDIARYCKHSGLPGEADVFALAALTIEPLDAQAHTLLEHVRRGERWFVKRGGRTIAFDDLVGAGADFGEAWELRSSHYAVVTNVALRDAVWMVLDLERFYRAFFALLARDLELHDVVEAMTIAVHADSQSFPEGSAQRRAYFDVELNRMLVNAEGGLDRSVLFHEGTHALLYNTAVRTRSGRGLVPGWLDEGLAEYFGNAHQGPPGKAELALGEPQEGHFSTHRAAKKPYDLGRLLTMSCGDFLASSKVDLKYAQAYTLVHFCLHGDGGKYRDGFLEFLRRAYAGQASSSDFKDALAIREREFEEAWFAHVGRNE